MPTPPSFMSWIIIIWSMIASACLTLAVVHGLIWFHCDSRGEVVVRFLSKVLVVCAIFVAGCASDRNAATNRFFSQGTLAPQDTENRDEISYWNGTDSRGEPRIVIDLDQQRAYFYKGDQIVGVSVVSTGREGYDTPSGEFRITEKTRSMSRAFTEITSTKAGRS